MQSLFYDKEQMTPDWIRKWQLQYLLLTALGNGQADKPHTTAQRKKERSPANPLPLGDAMQGAGQLLVLAHGALARWWGFGGVALSMPRTGRCTPRTLFTNTHRACRSALNACIVPADGQRGMGIHYPMHGTEGVLRLQQASVEKLIWEIRQPHHHPGGVGGFLEPSHSLSIPAVILSRAAT